MKRLLQISFDTILVSALPIAMWLVLGMTVAPEVANVFSLAYPLQFVYLIFLSLFAIGPNITARKTKDRDVVFANLTLGIVVVGIFTVVMCVLADSYIGLMNMDAATYHEFFVYELWLAFLIFIVQMISQKLYYEGRNTASNVMNVIFNGGNFLLIVVLLEVLAQPTAILVTLMVDAMMIVIFLLLFVRPRKFRLCILKNAKNVSFDLLDNLGMFLAYAVGFGNSFSFGEKYILAINFETLTTDAQWDALYAIDTAARIDISEKKLRFKKSVKEGYKLIAILYASILVMDFALYWYYRPDLMILSILMAVQLVDMLLQPLILARWAYLQIEDNRFSHNAAYFGIRFVRILISFLPTAYCTYIGQIVSTGLKYVYAKARCRKVKLFKRT